jgi:hypothetical protein
MPSNELAAPDQAGTLTIPGTGEAFDLTKPEDVVRAGYYLQELGSQVRAAKTKVDAVSRFHMRANAAIRFDHGRYGAVEKSGHAEYNGQAIYDAAIEEGLPQDAVERMIPLERRAASGTELNKLASRDERWRKAIAAGTNRKPGSVRYELQKAGEIAPATPQAIQQHVAADQAAERDARELGI